MARQISIIFGILAVVSTAFSALGSEAWAATDPFRAFSCDEGRALSASEGQSVLQRAQRAYEKSSTLRARFLQRSYLAAVDTLETSSGEVTVQKPGRMKWHYTTPTEQLFLVRDNTVWLHQVAERQVLIDEFRSVLITDLPVSFLMGLGDLSERFELLRGCRSADGVVLSLTPRGANAAENDQLSKFQLLVNGSSGEVQGAEVTDVVGNTTTILLSQITTTPAATEGEFAATFPRGTDIIDQRSRS